MANKFELKKVESTEFDTPVIFTDQDRKIMPYGFLTTYREMAWKNYKRAEFEASTRNFNITVGMFPDDRRSVIGRGFSRSKNTLFEGALRDAEYVLKQNDRDKEAIFLQALSRYELGDFEDGLRAFHNGMNKRGKRPEFRNGRYQAEGTIEDCVGRYAGPVLTDMTVVIRKMDLKNERERKLKERASKYVDDLGIPAPPPCSYFEWNRYIRSQSLLNSVLAETYLGKLNNDRKWFMQALENPNVPSVNKNGTNKMLKLAKKALDDLNKRKEILQSRKPYYHIKFQIEHSEKLLKKKKDKVNIELQKLMTNVIEKMLNNLYRERRLRNTKNCVEIGDRIKKNLDRTPKKWLPSKKEFANVLYSTMGLVYLDLKKLKPHLTRVENYKRLLYWFGFDGPYLDLKMEPLVQETGYPFADYKKWMSTYENYLEFAGSELERAWIHHEIGRCYGEFHKWEHMTLRGRKCFFAAKNCNSIVWMINGLFMMAVGEMNSHNKEEAQTSLKECLECAYRYKDESVIEFLLLATQVLNEKDFQEALVDTEYIIRKREEFIINLMHDPDTRERAKDLFNRMTPLPAKRKMSICPGIKPKNGKTCSYGRRSIIPGGSGGRLGLHPVNECTYDEFIDIRSEAIVTK
ncbi:hypothetical protein RUM44_008905 [Polyplax serrata]|uniref:Uncharacterized protein n=1 Tax=Polyplax serrata TaxID=468196 RepID=A0ABR1ASW5_POLSC